MTNRDRYERNYVPNKRNEVYRLSHADGQKEYWSYYATGEVASYTNGFGTSDQTMAAYGYDAMGRPTGITYTPSNTPNVTIGYANYGRTVTMEDGTGTTTWTYDGFGRLTSLNQPQGNITYGYTTYLDDQISMTDPSGQTSYEYDTWGRLKKLTNPLSEITEWAYDSAGRVNKRTLHNGTWEDISYNSRSRVSWILLKKPSPTTTLRSHGYTYDDASNVLTHAVGGVTTTYGYDNANQLTSESRSGYSCSYSYDYNGNRATRTLNGTTEIYANDAADKLTSISVGGNVVRSFTYDYLGRRKTDTYSGATTTYSWDQESRIASIARTGMSTHTFGYNGLDTRTSKTVGSATTSYLRKGAHVTNGVLKEVTGSTTTKHTPGISERRGTASTQYMHGGIKNADARTSGQAVDATRVYDAFGNVEGGSGTWSGPFGYAGGFGYQEDSESGLKLLGHRYYDSTTGRFLSKDPAAYGRNWTAYCRNNPLGHIDPAGFEERNMTGAEKANFKKAIGRLADDQYEAAIALERALKEGRIRVDTSLGEGEWAYVSHATGLLPPYGTDDIIYINPSGLDFARYGAKGVEQTANLLEFVSYIYHEWWHCANHGRPWGLAVKAQYEAAAWTRQAKYLRQQASEGSGHSAKLRKALQSRLESVEESANEYRRQAGWGPLK